MDYTTTHPQQQDLYLPLYSAVTCPEATLPLVISMQTEGRARPHSGINVRVCRFLVNILKLQWPLNKRRDSWYLHKSTRPLTGSTFRKHSWRREVKASIVGQSSVIKSSCIHFASSYSPERGKGNRKDHKHVAHESRDKFSWDRICHRSPGNFLHFIDSHSNLSFFLHVLGQVRREFKWGNMNVKAIAIGLS